MKKSSRPTFKEVAEAAKRVFRKSLTTTGLKKQIASTLKCEESVLNEPTYDNCINVTQKKLKTKRGRKKRIIVKAKEEPLNSQENPVSDKKLSAFRGTPIQQRTAAPAFQHLREQNQKTQRKRKFEDDELETSRKRMRISAEKIKELTPTELNARKRRIQLPAKSPLAKWALATANVIIADVSSRFDIEIQQLSKGYLEGSYLKNPKSSPKTSTPTQTPVLKEASLRVNDKIILDSPVPLDTTREIGPEICIREEDAKNSAMPLEKEADCLNIESLPELVESGTVAAVEKLDHQTDDSATVEKELSEPLVVEENVGETSKPVKQSKEPIEKETEIIDLCEAEDEPIEAEDEPIEAEKEPLEAEVEESPEPAYDAPVFCEATEPENQQGGLDLQSLLGALNSPLAKIPSKPASQKSEVQEILILKPDGRMVFKRKSTGEEREMNFSKKVKKEEVKTEVKVEVKTETKAPTAPIIESTEEIVGIKDATSSELEVAGKVDFPSEVDDKIAAEKKEKLDEPTVGGDMDVEFSTNVTDQAESDSASKSNEVIEEQSKNIDQLKDDMEIEVESEPPQIAEETVDIEKECEITDQSKADVEMEIADPAQTSEEKVEISKEGKETLEPIAEEMEVEQQDSAISEVDEQVAKEVSPESQDDKKENEPQSEVAGIEVFCLDDPAPGLDLSQEDEIILQQEHENAGSEDTELTSTESDIEGKTSECTVKPLENSLSEKAPASLHMNRLTIPKKKQRQTTPIRETTKPLNSLQLTAISSRKAPIKSLLKKMNKKENATQTPRRVKFTIPTGGPFGGGKYARFKQAKKKNKLPKPLKDEEVQERIRKGMLQRQRKKGIKASGFSPRYQSPSSTGKRRPKKSHSPMMSVPLQREKLKRLAGKAKKSMIAETLKKGNYKPRPPKAIDRRYSRGKRLLAMAVQVKKL